jgi:hypothetical protein
MKKDNIQIDLNSPQVSEVLLAGGRIIWSASNNHNAFVLIEMPPLDGEWKFKSFRTYNAPAREKTTTLFRSMCYNWTKRATLDDVMKAYYSDWTTNDVRQLANDIGGSLRDGYDAWKNGDCSIQDWKESKPFYGDFDAGSLT